MMPAPDYVQLEGRKLDEFLNHRGNFTLEERELFKKLCSFWETVIPYRRFLRHVGENTENERILNSLLSKLYQAGVGVIKSGKGEDGSLVPDGIVLTSDRSARFYKYAVDEYLRTVRHDLDRPLPFVGELARIGLQVPEVYLTDIAATEIATLLSESHEDDDRILRITTPSRLQVIITANYVRSFLGLAMRKLRHLLGNTNTLAAVARLLDTSLTALQGKLQGKEPRFWFRLTETILTEREQLATQRSVPVEDEFFAAAEVLHAFVDGQITEFKRRKRAEQERIETIQSILSMISQLDSPVMAISDLRSLIESYREVFDDDFEAFRRDFFETALQPPQRRKLAILHEFDDVFVHRDRLYPFFLSEIERLHDELRRHYIDLMRYSIRGKRRDDAFYSYAAFVADIEEKAKHDEPLFDLMYGSPEIMSEALLHWAKKQGFVTDQGQLRKLLGRHFIPGTTSFVSMDILLDLRLDEIFESAFRSLSPVRQFVYKIFGRYEALRERYTAEHAGRNASDSIWKPTDDPARGTIADDSGGMRRDKENVIPAATAGSGKNPATFPSAATRKRPSLSGTRARSGNKSSDMSKVDTKPNKQRQYTRRESERAWEEFKRRIES